MSRLRPIKTRPLPPNNTMHQAGRTAVEIIMDERGSTMKEDVMRLVEAQIAGGVDLSPEEMVEAAFVMVNKINLFMREKTMNKVIRRKVLSSTASDKVDLFLNYLQQQFPQAEVVKELQFHPDRKWRFDYAFPSRKIAIEIDGAIWTLGRHNRPRGYLNDMEKLNTAASMGWLVLRFSTDERFYLSTRRLIEVTLVQRANNNQ